MERKRLIYADNRATDTGVGFNGFAILTIEGRTMKIDYYAVTVGDDKPQMVVSEGFTLDRDGNVDTSGVVHALPGGSGFINRSDKQASLSMGAASKPN